MCIRLLALTRYSRLGASSRLRFYQYGEALASSGWDVAFSPLLGDSYIQGLYERGKRNRLEILEAYFARLRTMLECRRFDLLWVEKELFPMLPPWLEGILGRFGPAYVADYDDAIFHNYDMSPNPLVRCLLGRKISGVMRSASLVTAGNGYLAERARESGAARVEIIPTVLDPSRYRAKFLRSETFTIGWIGSPPTEKYLLPLVPLLSEFRKKANYRMIAVGAKNFGVPGENVELRPWSEETEARDIEAFDVGIMPLPDGPWERGKCAYKLIQYMAGGKPVIASSVGVNREIVKDGWNGFLASGMEEWSRALETIHGNPLLAAEMGRRNRKLVEERYSLQSVFPRLESLLAEAASRSRA